MTYTVGQAPSIQIVNIPDSDTCGIFDLRQYSAFPWFTVFKD